MMKKLQPEDARILSWEYNPDGATKEEQRGAGESVKCLLYSIVEHDQLFGRVTLEPGANHGKVTAENTCYYYVLSGQVSFFVYGNCGKCTTDRQDLGENEAIVIEKGTLFDYQAFYSGSADLILIRNYA